MKKILLSFGLLMGCIGILKAELVNGIALVVEGEAVTVAERRAVQKQMQVDKSQATDLLIQDRLQKIAMRDITINEERIDKQIAQIAKQNKLSVPKMQKILSEQGTSWVAYRQSVRDGLKKSKFYQEVIAATVPEPTEDELRLYYRNHKKEFVLPSIINMLEYTASSKKKIDALVKTGKDSGISFKNIQKHTKTTDGALLSMLLSVPNGGYTKIINAGDKYVVYKVLSKEGKTTMPFDIARNMVMQAWKQTQQAQSLKDYFQKLRTRADIQILR